MLTACWCLDYKCVFEANSFMRVPRLLSFLAGLAVIVEDYKLVVGQRRNADVVVPFRPPLFDLRQARRGVLLPVAFQRRLLDFGRWLVWIVFP